MNTTTSALLARLDLNPAAAKALKTAAQLWFVAAAVGLVIFAYFIVVFYGPSSLSGNFEAWTKNKMLLKGYVAGDTVGNLFFAAHVLLAAIIAFVGLLQLVPQIRTRAAGIHRWNGRVFLVAVMAASIVGLYLTWVRGTNPVIVGSLAISLDALLILTFAALAWRAARARDFVSHRRWALRTFIVACGVWFQRLGYMAWLIINQGPVGITENMDGAFDIVWGFACYLLPLGLLEIYLRAKDSRSPRARFAMAGALLVFTGVMVVGIFGATMFMWRPILAKV